MNRRTITNGYLLAHDALRLPAASLLANSGLCVNIEIEI